MRQFSIIKLVALADDVEFVLASIFVEVAGFPNDELL